jgi:hypothetical protein
MSQTLPEPRGRTITEQEIREALDAMVAGNGGYPIFIEGTLHRTPVKAKKPFT